MLVNGEPVENKASTKLKLKKPINPQFIAPIIVNIRVIYCSVSI